RTLVGNAFRQGFYWPTAVADATDVMRTYEGCQFYARKTHLPAHVLQTIPITWPFAVWGLDLVGPLQKVHGGFTHLLVAVDKFSKWIELDPSARSNPSKRFYSSPTSSSGSGSRIRSSPITAPNSQARSS